MQSETLICTARWSCLRRFASFPKVLPQPKRMPVSCADVPNTTRDKHESVLPGKHLSARCARNQSQLSEAESRRRSSLRPAYRRVLYHAHNRGQEPERAPARLPQFTRARPRLTSRGNSFHHDCADSGNDPPKNNMRALDKDTGHLCMEHFRPLQDSVSLATIPSPAHCCGTVHSGTPPTSLAPTKPPRFL
jgi:hypothetical protein